jgi:hypothetical protein
MGCCALHCGKWGVACLFHLGCGPTNDIKWERGLGFLPPQPRDSTSRPPPQIHSPNLTKLLPLLPPSPAVANGLVPCLAPSTTPTSPTVASTTFPYSHRCHLPLQLLPPLAPSHSRHRLTSPLAPPMTEMPQRHHRRSTDALVKISRRPRCLTTSMHLST